MLKHMMDKWDSYLSILLGVFLAIENALWVYVFDHF